MSDEKIVTFHFVSGKTIDVSYSNKALDELVQVLKRNWMASTCIGPELGINFSLVTHYEIKQKN